MCSVPPCPGCAAEKTAMRPCVRLRTNPGPDHGGRCSAVSSDTVTSKPAVRPSSRLRSRRRQATRLHCSTDSPLRRARLTAADEPSIPRRMTSLSIARRAARNRPSPQPTSTTDAGAQCRRTRAANPAQSPSSRQFQKSSLYASGGSRWEATARPSQRAKATALRTRHLTAGGGRPRPARRACGPSRLRHPFIANWRIAQGPPLPQRLP